MYKQDTKQISSIFMKHFNDLMSIQSLDELKSQIERIVTESKIKEIDKRKILYDISPLETTRSLQFYLTNSMLKYSGMGIK